jgi:branched-chain amino acid transport system permease protein
MVQLAVADRLWRVAPQARRFARTSIVAPAALIIFTLGAFVASGHQYAFVIQLAITGIGPGAIAALSGMGVVVTYRATGVFNFAQGTVATLVAYCYWEMAKKHNVPVPLAGLIAIILVGPAVGLFVERLIFRPLDRRGASTSEKLVASLGLTVLVLGFCVTVWGQQTRIAPALLPYQNHNPLQPFGANYAISTAAIGEVIVLVIASIGLTALFRFTRLGTEIRAVVDKRDLAELAGVNANRVSAISWAIGCGFAGLVGVLYASSVALDPYRTTLLVIDTFAVAVIARLSNLPSAVVGGIVLGMVEGMIGAFHINGPLAGPIQADILAIALPVFLVLYRRLDEVGTAAAATRSIVTARFSAARQRVGPLTALLWIVISVCVIGLPGLLHQQSLGHAQDIVALSVAFLSIVAVTGFSGNITLGQAGFAGLGAFLTAKLSTGFFPGLPKLPVIVSILFSGVMVAVLGTITGFLVLRRRGLILGLLTIAVGVLLDTMLFREDSFFTGFGFLHRPNLFGLDLSGDRAYYWFELVVLALALLLVRNLRSGRLGRILGAMRDSETAATSVGISLRKYKLFIFAVGAFLAAVGGSLLMLADMAFAEVNYSPLYSLFWFTAVVVAGLSYLAGAPVAAFLFVVFDVITQRQGASLFIIGLLAVLIAFLPGGLVGSLSRLVRHGGIPGSLKARYADAQAAAEEQQEDEELSEEADAEPKPVASPLAHQLLEQRG